MTFRRYAILTAILSGILFVFSFTSVFAGEVIFPQFVDGDGAYSEFLITNPESGEVVVTVGFFDASGAPLEVEVDGTLVTSFEIRVPAEGSRRFQTAGSGDLRLGYARAETEDPAQEIGIGLVYHLLGFEISVSGGDPGREASLYMEHTENASSALAMVNPGEELLDVTGWLLDGDGSPTAMGVWSLDPGQKTAQFVDELFPGLPEGFVGSLHLLSSAPLAELGLRQSADGAVAAVPALDRISSELVGTTTLLVGTNDGIQEVTRRGFSLAFHARQRTLDVYDGQIFARTGQDEVSILSPDYTPVDTIAIQNETGFVWVELNVVSDEEIVLFDTREDQLHVVNRAGEVLATVEIPVDPNTTLESTSGTLWQGDLLFVGWGFDIWSLDLETFEISRFMDVSSIPSAPYNLEASENALYFGRSRRIHRYRQGEGIVEVANLPENNIIDYEIHDGFLYAAVNFAGAVYRVSLADGSYVKWIQGLDFPNSMEIAPATGE